MNTKLYEDECHETSHGEYNNRCSLWHLTTNVTRNTKNVETWISLI